MRVAKENALSSPPPRPCGLARPSDSCATPRYRCPLRLLVLRDASQTPSFWLSALWFSQKWWVCEARCFLISQKLEVCAGFSSCRPRKLLCSGFNVSLVSKAEGFACRGGSARCSRALGIRWHFRFMGVEVARCGKSRIVPKRLV